MTKKENPITEDLPLTEDGRDFAEQVGQKQVPKMKYQQEEADIETVFQSMIYAIKIIFLQIITQI